MTEPLPERLSHRAASALRSNLLTFPLVAILGFAATLVLARVLSPSAFAVYALAIALRSAVQFLADLGTGAGSSRLFAQLEEQRLGSQARSLYRRLMGARLAVAVLMLALVIAVPDDLADLLSLEDQDQAVVVLLVALCAAEVCGGLGGYVLTATLRQRDLNRVTVLQYTLQPLALICAVALGGDVVSVLAVLLAIAAARAVALHVLSWTSLRHLPHSSGLPAPAMAATLGKTSAAAGVGKLATWVHSRAALSAFLIAAAGKPEFAIFVIGYDLVHQALSVVSTPAGRVATPVLAKTEPLSPAQSEASAAAMRALSLAAGAVALVLVIAGPVLDSAIFGDPYAGAGTYIAILAPAVALELALVVPATGVLLSADSMLRRYSIARLLVVLAGVAYVFTGFSDLVAVAIVMAAARGGGAILLAFVLRSAVGGTPDGRWWLRTGGALAIAAAVGLLVSNSELPTVPRGVGGAAIAVGLLALFVWRSGALSRADLAFARTVLQRPG